jgi:hypothetical protein
MNKARNNFRNDMREAIKIGDLIGQLNLKNQTYVLNTINALLFSQQIREDDVKKTISTKN